MILNLTQHRATEFQRAAGVHDLPEDQRTELIALLSFEEIPTEEEILDRAVDIAELACFNGLGGDEGEDPVPTSAMIGGDFWLMSPLANELRTRGIVPQFAFSKRKCVERTKEDGTVGREYVFVHEGWVPAF